MAVSVGAILEGVVTGITPFGAFIEIDGGVTGLVHISEVADVYVKDVKDYIKEQERVKVKVISIDANGKIGLSIKQVKSINKGPIRNKYDRNKVRNQVSFEDKLSKFLKESEEKQLEFRKKTDAKRGGRGSARN